MSIPVQWRDDDEFIVTTLQDAIGQLAALTAALEKVKARDVEMTLAAFDARCERDSLRQQLALESERVEAKQAAYERCAEQLAEAVARETALREALEKADNALWTIRDLSEETGGPRSPSAEIAENVGKEIRAALASTQKDPA